MGSSTMGVRLDYLLHHHMQRPYRQLRFTRFVMQQKVLAQLCNQITGASRYVDSRRTLVGVGNWSNNDPGGFFKSCPAGPVKKLVHLLSQKCSIVIVDEYHTSKLCAECATELCAMKGTIKQKSRSGASSVEQIGDQALGGKASRYKWHAGDVYSVRLCPNKVCHARVNRDVNASRNILALLQASLRREARPAPFSRSRPP